MARKKRAAKDRREHTNRYAGAHDAQAVLDFHGLGSIDGKTVKQKTEAFIRASKARQLTCVRIVTGKGNRSMGEPLVGPQVRRTLQALAKEGLVLAFQAERLDRGGEGALRVDL